MSEAKQSPKVIAFSWGKVEVEGYETVFRDVKIFPGGARKWDWSETGTHHDPGIQPADVEEVLQHGAKIVILSKGVEERLKGSPETIEMLSDRHITTEILQTEQAVERYNMLVANRESVGILIHSTC